MIVVVVVVVVIIVVVIQVVTGGIIMFVIVSSFIVATIIVVGDTTSTTKVAMTTTSTITTTTTIILLVSHRRKLTSTISSIFRTSSAHISSPILGADYDCYDDTTSVTTSKIDNHHFKLFSGVCLACMGASYSDAPNIPRSTQLARFPQSVNSLRPSCSSAQVVLVLAHR